MFGLREWFGGASRSSRRASKRSGRRRLRLEGLEPRNLLSAVAVNPTAVPVAISNEAPAPVIAAPIANPADQGLAVVQAASVNASPAIAVNSTAALIAIPNSAPATVSPAPIASPTDSGLAAAEAASAGAADVNSAAVTKYNGTYSGRASGPFPQIRFSVRNGLVNVTSPGRGRGPIDGKGNINFTIKVKDPRNGSLINITLKGHFTVGGGMAKASGRWTVAGVGGSWIATRVHR